MQQSTDTILMIRPVNFRMNEQTAVNNYFQEDIDLKNAEINIKAQAEFDAFVEKLEAVGVNVIVESDDVEDDTPDSIFPNNWVSFHKNGNVAIYPMFAENRRLERREEVFLRLEDEGFKIENIIDTKTHIITEEVKFSEECMEILILSLNFVGPVLLYPNINNYCTLFLLMYWLVIKTVKL